MKRQRRSILRHYSPIKIYFDDLQEIIAIFERDNIVHEIKTEGFVWDSIEELKDKERKIVDLTITSSEPYVAVNLRSFETSLFVGDDDIKSAGILHKIDLIIKKRIRNIYSGWRPTILKGV